MRESRDFFWPSYVDLMTALFLIMLVLFVLGFKRSNDKQRDNERLISELKVQVAEKRKLDEIKAALKRLESNYFEYNPAYKRYELKFPVTFAPKSDVLPYDAQEPLVKAGRFLPEPDAVDKKRRQRAVPGGSGGPGRQRPALPRHRPAHLDGPAVRQLSYRPGAGRAAPLGAGGPCGSQQPGGGGGRQRLPRGRPLHGSQEALNKRFIIQIQPKIGSIGK